MAGSVGPLGRTISPDDISFDDAVEAFSEAIAGLKEGGVSMRIFETFTNKDEIIAAVHAAGQSGMDYIPSMSPTSAIVLRSIQLKISLPIFRKSFPLRS